MSAEPVELNLLYQRAEQHIPGEQCFCRPSRLQVCPWCEDMTEPPSDCPQCKGEGLIPLSDPTGPYIVVHNTKLELSEEQQRRRRMAMFRARHAIRKGVLDEGDDFDEAAYAG